MEKRNDNKWYDDIFEETETKTKESLIKSLQGLRSIDEEAQMDKGKRLKAIYSLMVG